MTLVESSNRARALSLLSGGLDSQLAICVLREQGVHVEGVVFDSPFFNPDLARRAAGRLGLALHVIDFSSDIIALVKDPPHGFGSCMNPCIDCHACMLKRAGERMEDLGFHFLSTGEVLDQRPMSQNRGSLSTVARDSGYADVIVRPLSAKHLAETLPERRGWVDRNRLLGLQGRGRKPQLDMAKRYGLTDIPMPAGGCRLTEPNFCRRLKDLQLHEGLVGVRAIKLLRYGRHFRLSDRVKAIVGRNQPDNVALEGCAELYDLVLKPEHVPGPTCLVPFTAQEGEIERSAAICARYSDHDKSDQVTVRIRSPRGVRKIDVSPMPVDEAERFRV